MIPCVQAVNPKRHSVTCGHSSSAGGKSAIRFRAPFGCIGQIAPPVTERPFDTRRIQ
ncbi:hypothetical protein EMIT0158MI4_40396 [Burkholderia ambifaria]